MYPSLHKHSLSQSLFLRCSMCVSRYQKRRKESWRGSVKNSGGLRFVLIRFDASPLFMARVFFAQKSRNLRVERFICPKRGLVLLLKSPMTHLHVSTADFRTSKSPQRLGC